MLSIKYYLCPLLPLLKHGGNHTETLIRFISFLVTNIFTSVGLTFEFTAVHSSFVTFFPSNLLIFLASTQKNNDPTFAGNNSTFIFYFTKRWFEGMISV